MNIDEIKEWSKSKIKGNLWKILGPIALVSIISSFGFEYYYGESDTSSIKIFVNLFTSILEVGLVSYLVNFVTDKETNVGMVFSKFGKWWKIILTNILSGLFVFLYLLLLIVPGIIKAYEFAMIKYLLADEKYDDYTSKELLDISKKMMDGHKMDLFVLSISFIGWHFLSIFTLFILEIWVIPYQQVSITKFMVNIKDDYERTNNNGFSVNNTSTVINNNINMNNNSAAVNNNGQVKYCPQCGTPNHIDNKFCSNCGTQI